MPGVKYAVYGCFFFKTTPGVTLHRSNIGGKTMVHLPVKIGDRWKFEKVN